MPARDTTFYEGPAGSGKTTRLRRRFADLIAAGVPPEGILFLVQSPTARRAGHEWTVRTVGRSLPGIPIQTWHAFAFGLVERHAGRLGYTQPPTMLTAPEQIALVREMLKDSDEQREWSLPGSVINLRGFARELSDLALRAQDRLIAPEDLAERARAATRPHLEEAGRFFRRYLNQLDDQNVVDAANLVTLAVSLLDRLADLPRPRHILVDDYHDVTHAMATLLEHLARDAETLTIAGDPASHIFEFHGTSLEPLQRAAAQFAPVRVERLETIHRGTPAPEAWVFEHLTEETDTIARECLRLHHREGLRWGECAIIVRRAGPLTHSLRRSLTQLGIPHVVAGEGRALAREPALAPVLDLARAALRSEEHPDLLPGILSSPAIGLDAYRVRDLVREARLRGTTLAGLAKAPPAGLDAGLAEALGRTARLLDGIRERNKAGDDVFWFLWAETDCFKDLVHAGRHEDLDAVEEFSRQFRRFAERRPGGTFAEYLEVLDAAEFGPHAWVPPEERRPDTVRILTPFQVAGLEFEAVIVAGCVEGTFPSPPRPRALFDLEALDPQPAGVRLARAAAGERRLLGVAASRARRRLLFTAARESGSGAPRIPSPLVERLGADWVPAPPVVEPLTGEEVEATARRTLLDSSRPEAERRRAIETLAALPGVDPGEWWYERDWTDPGLPLTPTPLRTSYSRLSVYENCPLQYLYQVELGLDPETTYQMILGSLIHDIIDRCQRGEIPASEEALLEALDAAWAPAIFPGPAIERQRRRDGEEMLRRWLEADAGREVLASEAFFSFPIDGAELRGVIDRIDRVGSRSVRVIDYKTGRQPKTDEEAAEDLQLAAYYLALRRVPELAELGEPRILELAYLGAFRKIRRASVNVTEQDREEFERRAEERLVGFVEAIAAERFQPSPTANCHWCSYRILCPVWPEGEEVRL